LNDPADRSTSRDPATIIVGGYDRTKAFSHVHIAMCRDWLIPVAQCTEERQRLEKASLQCCTDRQSTWQHWLSDTSGHKDTTR